MFLSREKAKIQKASPSKFDSKEWLETELCAYIGRIHSSLIEFIHITSFKCRKAGFLWPKQVFF